MDSAFVDALVLLRAEFMIFGDWTPAGYASVQAYGVSLTHILEHVGRVAICKCVIENGYFAFSQEGEHSLVFEVLDDDGETVVDLCAFSLAEPQHFGVGVGRAIVLGEANVRNPAAWAWGKALPVCRNPLSWFKARCRGVVILDHCYGPVIFREALGRLLAEDEQHAELRQMLCTPPVRKEMIVDPGTLKASKGRAA